MLLHLLLRQLTHLLRAWLKFRGVSLGVQILLLEHNLVQTFIDIATPIELLLELGFVELS